LRHGVDEAAVHRRDYSTTEWNVSLRAVGEFSSVIQYSSASVLYSSASPLLVRLSAFHLGSVVCRFIRPATVD